VFIPARLAVSDCKEKVYGEPRTIWRKMKLGQDSIGEKN
jgi:hypothetical protein